VDERLSTFDLRSSFGVMLALNTQILLLGVTYSSSTSHHFAEGLAEVPYRHRLPRRVRIRRPDGRLVRRRMVDYQPRPSLDGSYYGSRGTDFNRLGSMLESRGLVGITTIGNAVVRRFAMRDLVDLALAEAERDFNIFRTPDGEPSYMTPLADGQIVVADDTVDGAGRRGHHVWSVVDPAAMFRAADEGSESRARRAR
jgi:aminoglycoside N3'-acetyltransferase